MGLMKVFSGSEILAKNLQSRIEDHGVSTVLKDNIQSARLGGFGNTDLAVEVFIQETDFNKAHQIIEDFKIEMQ